MARFVGWKACVLLGVLAWAGCEGDITRPDVETLSVRADRYRVPEGETEPLQVVATDVNGESVPAAEVRWSSSDPAVAVVEGGAMLVARTPGVAAITASVRGASVTRTFRVGFRDVERGQMGMRVSGDGGLRHITLSRATIVEPVDGSRDVERTEIFTFPQTPDRPLTPGESYGLFASDFPADTVLWLQFLRGPSEGNLRFEAVLPQIRPDGTAVPYEGNHAVLRIRDAESPNRHTVFMPVQYVDVTVDDLQMPGVGTIDGNGTVRGSVSFEAAGLILEDQAFGNPRVVDQVSDETTMVYVEFEAPLDSWLLGHATYEIEGLEQGPVTVETETARTSAEGEHVTSHHWGSIWTGPSTVLNVTTLLRIAVDAPEIVVGPGRDADGTVPPFDGTTLEMRLLLGESGTLTDLGTLVATEGSVRVDDFQAPGLRTFGVIRGSVEATAGLEGATSGGSGPAGSAHIAGAFELSLTPICASRNPCE